MLNLDKFYDFGSITFCFFTYSSGQSFDLVVLGWYDEFEKLASIAMLSRLTSPKTIPRWVIRKASISSISCTNSIQVDPDADQNIIYATDFDSKIQFLRNKLYPDSLVKVLCDTADVDDATKIFKWASLQRRFNHTADTYYWMIFKLGIAGNTMEMEGVCQNMIRDGCPGVEQALSSLVDSFVGHSRLDEAMRVLANMNVGGYRPSIEVFNAVLGAVVEEKRGFRDAVFVYKEMVKAGVAPTVDTLNHLLWVLFETGRVESALDQYRRMNNKGCNPNSMTLGILVKGLIANDKVDDSIAILREMLEIGCLPELSFYTCIIPLFCREDKLEEGIRLFSMMRSSNLSPDLFIYESLIQCLCKNHRSDDAEKLLEEMIQNRLTPSGDVFVYIVNEFCRLGKINEAMKLLEDKHVVEISAHNALLRACCNAGKFFVARGLFEKMLKRNTADIDSWNIVIRWLCENADIRKAYELLGRMFISSASPDPATHSALVIGNCRLNKCEDALRLFLQLHARCGVLDPPAYSELIESLCRTEKCVEAIKLFHYMSKNNSVLRSASFSMLMKCICEAGMVSEAVRLQLFAHSSGTSCSNATYDCILSGMLKFDLGEDALVFLAQMLVGGCNIDAEGYCTLIQCMIAQKRTKDCVLFFNRMVYEGFVPDSDTLDKLLSHLANDSQLHSISTTIYEHLSHHDVLNPAVYNLLIRGLWKEGNKTEARCLLDTMLQKGWIPDSQTHMLLMGSIEETGEKILACTSSVIKDDVSLILSEGLENT